MYTLMKLLKKQSLGMNDTCQVTDIATKVIKNNSDDKFADFSFLNLSNCIAL